MFDWNTETCKINIVFPLICFTKWLFWANSTKPPTLIWWFASKFSYLGSLALQSVYRWIVATSGGVFAGSVFAKPQESRPSLGCHCQHWPGTEHTQERTRASSTSPLLCYGSANYSCHGHWWVEGDGRCPPFTFERDGQYRRCPPTLHTNTFGLSRTTQKPHK